MQTTTQNTVIEEARKRVRNVISQQANKKETLILLKLKYRELLESGKKLPAFDDVEFRSLSMAGEDGILWYLFSLIGTTNKITVEACAGDGIECNSSNLILNDGWTGLLLEGDEYKSEIGKQFYNIHPDSRAWPPVVKKAWITAENVNDLIKDASIEGEIDLFILDIDGNDYWVWKALNIISPRVVLLEAQDILGPTRSCTIPYEPNFTKQNLGDISGEYIGASLAAFTKLGKEKGYRLVGCQRYGFNLFFLRNDIAPEIFPEISVESCLTHPKVIKGYKTRYPKIKDMPWVDV